MPAPKTLLNAFTVEDIHNYTKISLHMIDYLCRYGYLRPAYTTTKRARGRVRYFSYRDLVIASVVQRLLNTGVKLRRLKRAIKDLRQDQAWFPTGRRSDPIQWLVSDGSEVLLKHQDGFLDELRSGGQRAFAFVVNLHGVQQEVKAWLDPEKRRYFSMENLPMKIRTKKRTR
jgi:DNA-binding transcriptional MerR regulator